MADIDGLRSRPWSDIGNVTLSEILPHSFHGRSVKVYFAGKISKNDWRHDVVHDLRQSGWYWGRLRKSRGPWPVLRNAIFDRHHYVGPYFIGCDHGCFHGEKSSHAALSIPGYGCGGDKDGTLGGGLAPDDLLKRCERSIKRCDLFFVWIGDGETDCHGTLVEIGMAKMLGKTIVIATNASDKQLNEMWFACQCANAVVYASDPLDVLTQILGPQEEYEEPEDEPWEDEEPCLNQ